MARRKAMFFEKLVRKVGSSKFVGWTIFFNILLLDWALLQAGWTRINMMGVIASMILIHFMLITFAWLLPGCSWYDIIKTVLRFGQGIVYALSSLFAVYFLNEICALESAMRQYPPDLFNFRFNHYCLSMALYIFCVWISVFPSVIATVIALLMREKLYQGVPELIASWKKRDETT